MLNHYEQAANLHSQLKMALDEMYKKYNNIAVMQLCYALQSSAKHMQWANDENYKGLEEACGQPEVIAYFGYRNPCQNFEWVVF